MNYHFVMIAGWHPGGVSHNPQAKGRTPPACWWCADGDNFAVGDVLQFYLDKTLAVYARVKVPQEVNRWEFRRTGKTMERH